MLQKTDPGCQALHAPPTQRTMSFDQISITQTKPDTMHCSPATPFTKLLAFLKTSTVCLPGLLSLVLSFGFSLTRGHRRCARKSFLVNQALIKLPQKAVNHLAEVGEFTGNEIK